MNILFISFAEVSLHKGSVRSVAMLRALVDAGHRVDLIAPQADLAEHSNLRVLGESGQQPLSRLRLKLCAFRAAGRVSYDAIHAVDDAIFFATWLGRLKKVPVVYDAVRRFTGAASGDRSSALNFFPRYFRRLEARVLERARGVFASCAVLAADLVGLQRDAAVVVLDDIPMQSLSTQADMNADELLASFEGRPEIVVLCDVLEPDRASPRGLLMAARKVIDAVPGVSFFFRGVGGDHGVKMANSLDISGRCAFLDPDDSDAFLAVLSTASAVLMVPAPESRYVHGEVYTLLCSGVPLVAVQNGAYDKVLTQENCVRVFEGVDSMAEGLLRVVQEPLFSMALATAGQQLIADRHAYSSFKHKLRMMYHQVAKKE